MGEPWRSLRPPFDPKICQHFKNLVQNSAAINNCIVSHFGEKLGNIKLPGVVYYRTFTSPLTFSYNINCKCSGCKKQRLYTHTLPLFASCTVIFSLWEYNFVIKGYLPEQCFLSSQNLNSAGWILGKVGEAACMGD